MARNEWLVAIRAALVTLVLTGLLYPLAITGASMALFPDRARGSLLADDSGRVVGSELIAQAFTNAAYLWPRPSAAGENGYDASASGGSNLGPTSKALHDRAAKEVERVAKENPDAPGPVPVELVTASGSGLDPHLSPEAALWQAPRIAAARGVELDRVRTLIQASVEGRDLGLLGERRVNVLRLDLELDRYFGRPPATASR